MVIVTDTSDTQASWSYTVTAGRHGNTTSTTWCCIDRMLADLEHDLAEDAAERKRARRALLGSRAAARDVASRVRRRPVAPARSVATREHRAALATRAIAQRTRGTS